MEKKEKKFIIPELLKVQFENDDVIRTSDPLGGENDEQIPGN